PTMTAPEGSSTLPPTAAIFWAVVSRSPALVGEDAVAGAHGPTAVVTARTSAVRTMRLETATTGDTPREAISIHMVDKSVAPAPFILQTARFLY
ncbi:MAG TPA: hypothetical protein VNZ26_35090, partial [Vicinamibacterales bacterium]|nr:hypothetical protein [Vicinamibacterales bacterium]